MASATTVGAFRCSERKSGWISALRRLLRYSVLEGLVAADLDGSVLSVAGGGPFLLKGIATRVVDRGLASCDSHREIGRRD
jgi:hypothetical protein